MTSLDKDTIAARMRRGALLLGAALLAFVPLLLPSVAHAETQVTGTLSESGDLIIDPTFGLTEPTTKVISAYPTRPVTMFIQEMPVTKLVDEVTIGDVAWQGAGCGAAGYSLGITRSPEGAADGGQTTPESQWVASSVAAKLLPAEPGKVTWKIPPTYFEEGVGYLFGIRGTSSCTHIAVKTWPHNEAQVNQGIKRCDMVEGVAGFRMWHEQGQSDAVMCPPIYNEVPSGLEASMPTGWLAIHFFRGPSVRSIFGPKTGGEQCAAGQEKVFWRESPSLPGWYEFVCRWKMFPDLSAGKPPEGWYFAWGGNQVEGEARDTYLKLSMDESSVADFFRPKLYFDSSESWRPLDLNEMFEERYVLLNETESVPRHQVCPDGPPEPGYESECFGLNEPGELMAEYFNRDEARLDVQLFGPNEEIQEYVTPGCSTEVELWDCVGTSSAIYWRLTPAEPSEGEEEPYRYLQYWMFYRLNSFSDADSSALSRHEGDWEAVAIAPSVGKPGAFDFASFSQHGHWYSYLRDNLYCAGPLNESCGSEAEKAAPANLKVFPANGSHANYATKCSETTPFLSCEQNGLGLPERGHDGAVSWTHNSGPAGLLELPSSGSSWTFWKGEWGVSGGPHSPGRQAMFSRSWEECADDDEGCPMPGSTNWQAESAAMSSQPKARRPRLIKGPFVKGCEAWFGAEVAAILCERSRLAAAVERGGLGANAGMALSVRRQSPSESRQGAGIERDSSVGGLSQVVGRPLKIGDSIELSAAPIAKDWQLFLRIKLPEGVVDVRFPGVQFSSARIVRVRGMPALRTIDGAVRLPNAVRWSGPRVPDIRPAKRP